jgi:hypothetical protein
MTTLLILLGILAALTILAARFKAESIRQAAHIAEFNRDHPHHQNMNVNVGDHPRTPDELAKALHAQYQYRADRW